MTPLQALEPGDALLVVDVQPDFCPGGALAIADGDRVVEVANRYIAAALEKGVPATSAAAADRTLGELSRAGVRLA